MINDLIVREPGTDLTLRDDVDHGDQPLPPATTEQALRDRAATAACEAVLRREWGVEFERRVALNYWALETELGEEEAENLLFARLDDGRRVADVPAFSKALNDILCFALAHIEQEMEGSSIRGSSLEERKVAIEKIMRTDFGRYQQEFAVEYENVLNELVRQGKLDKETADD
jgi:hypothetical protein